MKKIIALVVTFSVLWHGWVMAETATKEFTYSGDGVEMTGFLAWDDSIDGPRPGVLVVHEWWGQNEYPRERAKMLAELGYTALALDIYGEGKQAEHPDDAGTFMRAALQNLPGMRDRFNAAMQVLREQPTVDAENIAAIGYCFGGGVVLHMARYGADLKAVASFHGSLGLGIAPEGEGSDVTARVVAYNGEADPWVTPEQIAGLSASMESAGAQFELVSLPGATHGFSNPAADINGEKFGLPLAYSPLADEASWAHMQLVLEAAFSE
ncbi:MAG TPA: dienelactone hydrolase family protein [Xanthomonadales bacterium]|nr:dienelactone hydrolase family protein [Xanthomonadales bacterium]